MPMQSVQLRPGVNTERSMLLNEAGVSQSQLVRYKDGLIQTYGGWEQLDAVTIASTIRAMHAWGGLSSHVHLGMGAVQSLNVYHSDDGTVSNITPQTFTTNPAPNFSISSGSNIVTVVDSNSGPSVYNTVFFNTPVAVGNMLLNGAYQVFGVLSTGSYTIQSSVTASTTIVSSGILPIFSVSSGSPTVLVTLPNNNFPTTLGLFESFYAPTTVGGLTIQGAYQITSIIDSTNFDITAPTQATATAASTMNGGNVQLVYYVTVGPQPSGTAYGAGGYGTGAYGGYGTGSAVTLGSPITANDWSMDNWGEILLACPSNGPIYTWSQNSGFINAQVITSAPFFNGGIFVSMPQQILVAWRSVQSTGTQDNLIVRWSDALDYTNWTVSNQTTAGSFHLPTGSIIIGGLQAPNFGVIWTDIDAWIMQYVGGDLIFNFTKVGTGCGLIGQHAADVIGGEVYWVGLSNVFKLGQSGAEVVPCTVWDFIYQQINPDYAFRTLCAPNSAFNEIAWFFPSGSNTENDSYIKFNTLEKEWDCGVLTRTAWIDVSVLGNPIGADNGGIVYQHEEGASQPGAPVTSFRSGWWSITEGNDLSYVDYVLPDFIWGTYGASTATVNITFYSANYAGDAPIAYGPYTVTQATQYLTPRIRGRLMSVLVQSNNGSFWRLGKIRFRYAVSGRR